MNNVYVYRLTFAGTFIGARQVMHLAFTDADLTVPIDGLW